MMGDLEKLRKSKREKERKLELVFSFFFFFHCVPRETDFYFLFFYQSKYLIMLFSPPITFLIFVEFHPIIIRN